MIIYKATNLINGKIYIGQTTVGLKKRKLRHLEENKRDKGIFKKALKKYGDDNFKWEIIDKANNIEELNEKEIFWIKHHKSMYNEYGYNLRIGGSRGTFNEATRKKMSEIGKQRAKEPNERKRLQEMRKLSNGFKGWRHLAEAKQKMSEKKKNIPSWNKDLKLSEEHKNNLSKSHIGKSSWNKGIPCRYETKKKLTLNSPHRKISQSIAYRLKFINKNMEVPLGYWKQVANSLNVSQQNICGIIKNRNWKYLEV